MTSTAITDPAVAEGTPETRPVRRRSHAIQRRVAIFGFRLLIVVMFLTLWSLLPRIGALSRRFRWLDPFFISSPGKVASKIVDLATGRDGSLVIWPYIARTLEAAFLGLLIGMVVGALAGLLLSNSPFLSQVVQPFIAALNATPRIAFIPIIVILFGPTRDASVAIAVLVVFFVAFFNAFEGGTTVPSQLLQNARVLGAKQRRVMLHVRFPYVVAWSMASLPVALAFSLLSVVTAEVLTGHNGVGRIISTASVTVDASLTIAVAIYLGVIGSVAVSLANFVKRRILHWWVAG